MKYHLFLILFLTICIPTFSQKTGVAGQLYWNQPVSNSDHLDRTIPYSGIPLEIFIHELTTMAEVDLDDDKISKIYTPLVKRVFAKWNGSFKVKLPPGQYSIFVFYKNHYFGNLQDKKGNLSPAFVEHNKKSWVTITIDYSSYH
ncbi:MAG TPA: hypothetical protein PKJ63_00555 [Cyclobacteriaceae bacterium]|nr:hypothetical protein [Cyclobacteriaceae bacterium]